MPPSNSLKLEQHIIEIFDSCDSFTFNSIDYKIKNVGKPRPSHGECKTDVYVKAVDSKQNPLELRISVKDIQTNEAEVYFFVKNLESSVLYKICTNLLCCHFY